MPQRQPIRNDEALSQDDLDLLWGTKAIAKFIRRTPRQTEYLIQRKIIPTKNLSHKMIVGSRSQITGKLK